MAKSMIDTFEHGAAAIPARTANGRRPVNGQRPADPQAAGAPVPATGGEPVVRFGWSPARLAYWFYAVAAAGAVIGQTWVAIGHLPWGSGVPLWTRVAAVLPFALCLELLAMALAAMADERMRLGERAYGFRAFSAAVAAVAVGIQVAGHWPNVYWSGVFGVLSSSAYSLWLLHGAARRRDALRAAGKLAETAPDYGLWRRMRHPVWTARAAELAREGQVDATSGRWRPLGLYESLRAAQLVMGDEKRRPAIAGAVEQIVRSDQRDPRMAEVAVRTLDLDRLAAELADRVDYGAWADRLAPAVTAPLPVARLASVPVALAAGKMPDTAGNADSSEINAVKQGTTDLQPTTVPTDDRALPPTPATATTPASVAAAPPTNPEVSAGAVHSQKGSTATPQAATPEAAGREHAYRPTTADDTVMYQTWLRGIVAGEEPSGADLARAAGRRDDGTGTGRRALRRYRAAHGPDPTVSAPTPNMATRESRRHHSRRQRGHVPIAPPAA